MEVKKLLELPTIEYYITHLNIVNTIIPKQLRISPREVEVLATLMSLPPSTRFTIHGRKQVRDILSLSPSSLSNHLKSLVDKTFISIDQQTNDYIDIAPKYIPFSYTTELSDKDYT